MGYKRIHPRARAPERATPGAAGFDIAACLDGALTLEPGRVVLVPTGLALAIPRGMEGQVRARSGLALRHGIAVLNGPGTIDSDYRGPLGVILANLGREPFQIKDGDRIAQIVFAHVPTVELREETELDATDRGEGGFGHTGM
ncbi:MAG TPA: dUTP diphosphatase [Candidatus Eisenbacteria bacterium]|nr:dUTP diphosphatase [Candidatus Eisenbacteria bacterium]